MATRSDLYDRAGLTAKQREAADLYDAGKGYDRISKELGIAKATVRHHLIAVDTKIKRLRTNGATVDHSPCSCACHNQP